MIEFGGIIKAMVQIVLGVFKLKGELKMTVDVVGLLDVWMDEQIIVGERSSHQFQVQIKNIKGFMVQVWDIETGKSKHQINWQSPYGYAREGLPVTLNSPLYVYK